MSILIPGMKLPDDCRECPMEQYYSYCGETRCEVNGMILAGDYRALSYDGRHEDCPLKEIKTAKWLKVGGYCTPGGDPVWRCSNCGKGTHVYGIEASSYQGDVSDQQWVTCPNCGAIIHDE